MTYNPAATGSGDNAKQTWETPHYLFNYYNSELHYIWDLAANESNAKCQSYYTEEDNALSKDWCLIPGNLWLNPPFSSEKAPMGVWAEKCHRDHVPGRIITMLCPVSKMDQAWFARYVIDKTFIQVVIGRVNFVGSSTSNPWPLLVIHFGAPIGISSVSRDKMIEVYNAKKQK